MLYLRDVLKYLELRGSAGSNMDDLQNHFNEEPLEDIKRLLESALGFKEIQKIGKGRGARYYLSGIDIVSNKIESDPLDLSDCKTQKEKADKIFTSEFPIDKIYEFSYRECITTPSKGKTLYDFLQQHAIDTQLKIIPTANNGKVMQVKNKYVGNKVTIGRDIDNKWVITLWDYRVMERPEIMTFESYGDFEKCLRTLFPK